MISETNEVQPKRDLKSIKHICKSVKPWHYMYAGMVCWHGMPMLLHSMVHLCFEQALEALEAFLPRPRAAVRLLPCLEIASAT